MEHLAVMAVRLTREMVDQLDALRTPGMRTRSAVIRQALADWLAQQQRATRTDDAAPAA